MAQINRRQGLSQIGTAVAAATLGASASQAAPQAAIGFDESNVQWGALPGFDHLWFHILNVDRDLGVVDVLFKFGAGQRIVPHRHLADYSTFIIQGELRIYDLDGTLREIRPTASFVQGKAGGAPHSEGGGDVDCIAWFSNKVTDGAIYEFLGPDGQVAGALGIDEVEALMQAQAAPVQPIKPS
ncbi:MAG: regulator [Pseudomonadota bacterium]